MMKENEIAALIEWGKEEKQPDFLGFVNFCIENRASKNLLEVEMDGERKGILKGRRYSIWGQF